MECNRLQKLIKNWYMQVQDESMAPARMVEFMRNHIAECLTCLADPVIEGEIKRITEVVLPPSKIPKAVRREEQKQDETDDDVDDDETEDEDDTDTDDIDEDGIDEDDDDDDDDDI